MRHTLRRWMVRYLPAEAAGLVAAFLGASLAHALNGHPAVIAMAAAWAENLGYYAIMIVRELRAERRVGRTLRNLALEFGRAEALDSFAVRPASMYLATTLVPELALAVLLGKLAADVAFYVPAIAAYELRLRLSRARDGMR
jgi:hypothetical protein